MKKVLQFILKIFSKMVLKKYRPDVIGITGSVGKTSTKEAIYTVLRSYFRVRRNFKSYNNEIGVPLSILGMETGGRSVFRWLKIFGRAIHLILVKDKDYPKILVLEMGADKIGDIKYLMSFVPLKIGVLVAIGPVHLEFFGKMEDIIREKQILITSLSKEGWAVINRDDELVYGLKEKTRASIITFGFKEGSDLRVAEVKIKKEEEKYALSFKLIYQGSVIPMLLPQVIGKHQIYGALVAAAIGIIYNLNPIKISEALKKYQSPPGRMKLIKGIKHTLIIDDTYNSSPVAAKRALETLKELKTFGSRWAVLGDMLELGKYTEEGHREVGRKVVQEGVDILVTVGERACHIAQGAREAGMRETKIFSFAKEEVAGKFIQSRLREGDLILIKGSQGMRMEKIVKELMAEPLRAQELLVRQEEEWLKR